MCEGNMLFSRTKISCFCMKTCLMFHLYLYSNTIHHTAVFHLQGAQEKHTGFFQSIIISVVAFWSASYSLCIVYYNPIKQQSLCLGALQRLL